MPSKKTSGPLHSCGTFSSFLTHVWPRHIRGTLFFTSLTTSHAPQNSTALLTCWLILCLVPSLFFSSYLPYGFAVYPYQEIPKKSARNTAAYFKATFFVLHDVLGFFPYDFCKRRMITTSTMVCQFNSLFIASGGPASRTCVFLASTGAKLPLGNTWKKWPRTWCSIGVAMRQWGTPEWNPADALTNAKERWALLDVPIVWVTC